MIFERRAYTFRPGCVPAFWQAQLRWNTGETFAPLLAHNLSYFEVLAGAAEQVVHLYRFANLDEWDEVYADLYANHSPQYFVEARRLMLAQENAFYRPAPVPGLNLGDAGVRATRGDDLDPDAALVTEITMRVLPGGLPAVWSAYDQYCSSDPDAARRNLIGTYFVLVGGFHTVKEYRWYSSHTDLDDVRREHRENAGYMRFIAACGEVAVATQTMLMRPAPLASHRSLFTRSGDALAMGSGETW